SRGSEETTLYARGFAVDSTGEAGEGKKGVQEETTLSEGEEFRVLVSTALESAFCSFRGTVEVDDRRSSFDLNRRERRSGMVTVSLVWELKGKRKEEGCVTSW